MCDHSQFHWPFLSVFLSWLLLIHTRWRNVTLLHIKYIHWEYQIKNHNIRAHPNNSNQPRAAICILSLLSCALFSKNTLLSCNLSHLCPAGSKSASNTVGLVFSRLHFNLVLSILAVIVHLFNSLWMARFSLKLLVYTNHFTCTRLKWWDFEILCTLYNVHIIIVHNFHSVIYLKYIKIFTHMKV